MRVLVTGGAGFIGSHLVDALLARGDDVVVLDALVPPVHAALTRPLYLAAAATFIAGSAEDPRAWEDALDRAELVFHLAAHQDYRPDYSRYYRVNTAGTALLYETLHRIEHHVGRVVFVSSQAVYGEGDRLCAEHGVVAGTPRDVRALDRQDWSVRCSRCERTTTSAWTAESSATEPRSVYGMSKLAGERAALRLGELERVDTVVVRPSIVIGPRQSPRNLYSGACRSFSVALFEGRPCEVFEDGEQRRDFVAVEDVVEALLVAADLAPAGSVLNVGGGSATTVNDLLGMVAAAVGREPETMRRGRYRHGDTRDALSDTARLRALGWAPRRSAAQAVRAYVSWLRSAPDTLAGAAAR